MGHFSEWRCTQSYFTSALREPSSVSALGLVASMAEMATRALVGVVGRSDELTHLRAFLAEPEQGPSALVVEGEAGIGKTTLWRAGVDAARELPALVLTAAPAEAETKLSF